MRVRLELRPAGIHVIVVRPASIHTPAADKLAYEADAQIAKLPPEGPGGRRDVLGARHGVFVTVKVTELPSRAAVPVSVAPSEARVAWKTPGKPKQISQVWMSPVAVTALPSRTGPEFQVPKK